jgi:predicted house-cleaning noncanonical NTP pyrophosphatase (MazG superfamily)
MGRWKGDGNHFPPQNNLIQDSERNEENRYRVPDSNKTKINDDKEPNAAHKNNLKEEILQVITENFMEMLLDMVIQNIPHTYQYWMLMDLLPSSKDTAC